jgi:hypothetical protein
MWYIHLMMDQDKIQRIAEEVAKATLGASVRWVTSTPIIDSREDEALRITVVVTPGSEDTLSGDELVDATVRIHDALQMQGEERYPFVHFVSEDELQAHAAP